MNTKQLSNKAYYAERINVITEYIQNHLDEKLSIQELADLSHFSPFHFHRIIRAQLGEPIGAYITRIRLEKAAHLLSYSTCSIEDIAYQVGYEVPSSLSKQFKNHFGVSPSEYRTTKEFSLKSIKTMELELAIKKPKIVEAEEKKCLFIRLKGNYQSLDYHSAWEKLWSVVKVQKLYTAGIEHIGVSYDDPHVTESDKMRYDACLVIHKNAKPEGEVGVKTLKGGKFAMFHYTGSYQFLSNVYDYIYDEWLLNNNYELRDEAPREVYRNNPERTPEEKLKTEIYLPIV